MSYDFSRLGEIEPDNKLEQKAAAPRYDFSRLNEIEPDRKAGYGVQAPPPAPVEEDGYQRAAALTNRWAAGPKMNDASRFDKTYAELRKYLGEEAPPAAFLSYSEASRQLQVSQMDHATRSAPYTARWAVERGWVGRVPYDLPGLAKVEKSYGQLLREFFSKPIVDMPGETPKHDTKSALYTYAAGPSAIAGHLAQEEMPATKRAVSAMPGDASSGLITTVRGALDSTQMLADNLHVTGQPLLTFMQGIRSSLRAAGYAMPGDVQESVSQFLGDLAEDIKDPIHPDAGVGERGWRSGITSMGGTVPMMLLAGPAAAALRAEAAAGTMFSTGMGLSVAGNTYRKNLEKTGNTQQAALHGILDGMAEFVFEKLGGDVVLLDKAAWAKGFLGGVVKFAAREIPSEIATTLTQNYNDWVFLNPEKSLEDFMSEQPDAVLETIVATLVGGGGQIAVMKGLEAAANRINGSAQADVEQQKLQELFTAATEAELFQNDPQAFGEFMQGVAPDQEVRIDAALLEQALADAGKTTADIPSLLEQGTLPGEVSVPMHELVTALAGTTSENTVIQNIRTDPEARTIAERRELGNKALEEFKATGARTLEKKRADDRFQGAYEALRDELAADLEATGVYKPGAVSTFADITATMHSVVASRLGITPLQFRDGWTDAKGNAHRGYNVTAANQQGPVKRDMPAATVKDFTPGRIGNILRRSNWAVVTAENPNNTELSPEENAARNEMLRAELQARGLRFREATGAEMVHEQVEGKYVAEGKEATAPLEHPFLVTGIDLATAREIAKKFDQESVLTPLGLVYNDDTVERALNVQEHETEPANYWTRIPSTGAMFTINLDFGNRVPLGGTAAPPDSVPAGPALRHAVVHSTDLMGDGRGFTDFFSGASHGMKKPDIQPEPVIDITGIPEFSEEYVKHRGNFDDHIAASIPGFREVQQAVGSAVAKTYAAGGVVLDVGASEGAWGKTVSAVTGGKVRTVNLDPNLAMAEHFNTHSVVPGAEYVVEAFGSKEDEGKEAWLEGDTTINFFKPDTKFDVVHEAMVFQFISNGRNAQVSRIKEMLKPGGLVLLEEKVIAILPGKPSALTPEQIANFTTEQKAFWDNEIQKDAYKAKHFSAKDIEEKKKVLEGDPAAAEKAQQQEQAVVGMNDLMATAAELEAVLSKHFKHVVQYWDSGNFKGFAASDNQSEVEAFLRNLPDLTSEFSTVVTPNPVHGMDTFAQRTAESVTNEIKKLMGKLAATEPGPRKEKMNDKLRALMVERTRRMDAEYEAARQMTLFQPAPAEPVTVVGVHFSHQPRTSLSTAAYGRGIEGAERPRVMAATDARIKRRAHFYVNTGVGIFPETGVGNSAHVATLANLYDSTVDQLGLFRDKSPTGLNKAESAVLDAGFDGYVSREFGNQGAAVVFRPNSIEPEFIGTQDEAVARAAVIPPAKWSTIQKLWIKLNSAKNLPAFGPPDMWDRILGKLYPEEHAILKEQGVFERAKGDLYKDELLRLAGPVGDELYQNRQDARGTFSPERMEYTLLAKANLSTFMHEMGHFYLKVYMDLALEMETRVANGETLTEGEQGILDDMLAVLEWMGGTPEPGKSDLLGSGVLEQSGGGDFEALLESVFNKASHYGTKYPVRGGDLRAAAEKLRLPEEFVRELVNQTKDGYTFAFNELLSRMTGGARAEDPTKNQFANKGVYVTLNTPEGRVVVTQGFEDYDGDGGVMLVAADATVPPAVALRHAADYAATRKTRLTWYSRRTEDKRARGRDTTNRAEFFDEVRKAAIALGLSPVETTFVLDTWGSLRDRMSVGTRAGDFLREMDKPGAPLKVKGLSINSVGRTDTASIETAWLIHAAEVAKIAPPKEGVLAQAEAPAAPAPGVLEQQALEWETLYRGENVGNKGGGFFTGDAEWARQFTQSGRESEVKKWYVRAADIYTPEVLAYGGDQDAVDAAIEEAKRLGYKAVRLSEGRGEPVSTFVFDRSALRVTEPRFYQGGAPGVGQNAVYVTKLHRVGNVKIIQNPTREHARLLIEKAQGKKLRGLRDPRTGDLYLWDAYDLMHQDAAVGVGYSGEEFDRLRIDDTDGHWNGLIFLNNADMPPLGYFAGEGGLLAQNAAFAQPTPRRLTLAEWAAMSTDQQRPYHEKFAETWEQYLFTGKAPTKKLEGLFRRISDWMRRVYLDMKRFFAERGLADLNPEISAVMDRMVATEREIAAAQERRAQELLFKNAVEAGMTPEQYAKYMTLPEEAKAEAEEQLRARALRDMKWMENRRNKTIAALQKEAAEKRKEMRAIVAEEVAEEPVFKAQKWLRHGIFKTDTGEEIQAMKGHKLHIPALESMFPAGVIEGATDWRKLGYGKYGMLAAEGIHPDMVAEMFGYRSGMALVDALLNAPNFKVEVEGRTDQRMLEKYGDLATPEGIARAADEAIMNDVRLKILATEMSYLNNTMGSPAAITRAARAYAQALIASRVVKNLKPAAYAADAARAGKAAMSAFGKGDSDLAAEQKRLEVLHHASAREAYAAEKEINKIVARLTKISKVKNDDSSAKNRNMDVVNAVRVVLSSFGFGTVVQGENARKYLDALKQQEPDIAAAMEDLVLTATANQKNWRNLKVSELRELAELVDSVWSVARRAKEMEIDGKRVSRQSIVDELLAAVEKHEPDTGKPDIGTKHAVTPEEQRKLTFSTVKALFRRVSDWAEAVDGGKKLGPFRKYVWFPIKDAADKYRAAKVDTLKQYRELLKPISGGFSGALIDAPELGYVFGKDPGVPAMSELLHAILHTGNDSNKRKLLLGRGWAAENADGTLDTTRWDRFIHRMQAAGTLTKAHYDFVQGVWDMLEGTKGAAQKAHRAVFGRSFDEVTANPFTTPFGTYAGGYVPAMVDSRIESDAALRELANAENESMVNAFPTPAKGFTIARVDYNRKLLLDLRTLAGHVDKVLLFSYLAEPIADVRRVLMSPELSKEINRIDPAAIASMFTPWLNRAAKQVVEVKKPGAGNLARFWSGARSRSGMAAMFANVVNTMQQFTGIFTAAVKVKPTYLIEANAQYLVHPKDTFAFVTENSPYMKERLTQGTSSMTGDVNDILINPGKYETVKAWSTKHAYFMQTAIDQAMGPIIWMGAYKQALDLGETHDDARKAADDVVRQTQGSQLPEEIANYEVGSPFYRMFTQFSGFFNSQANMLGTEFSKVSHELGLRKGLGRGFFLFTLGVLAPAMVSELIVQAFRGGPDDEDDDGEYLDDWISALTFGTARYVTAMAPGAGPAAIAVWNTFNHKPYDDRMSTAPAISMVETAVKAPSSIYRAWAEDENGKPGRAIMDSATAVSMLLGVPARSIAKPIAYAADVEADYIDPVDGLDYARGLITGTASPESKQ